MLVSRCWNCMEDVTGQNICPHCGFDPDAYSIPPHVLPPNTILHGKYLIGNVLGQGGFGITYLGFDLSLEMKVAIKEYYPSYKAVRSNAEALRVQWRFPAQTPVEHLQTGCAQFLAEARKMAKIHLIPEIVTVRETFEENNTAYIAMDYIPGTTLKNHIRTHGCISYSECATLLLPLIEGLAKVHEQGIIHRDISPDNLMLSTNGKVYLLDLGTATDVHDTAGPSAEAAAKVGFSPIEQNSEDGKIGPWTDIYALAASIYYCIYGKVLPPAAERLQNDTLQFPKTEKTTLGTKQTAVLQKALAVQPEQRYQSIMEFHSALNETKNEKPKKEPVKKESNQAEQPTKKRISKKKLGQIIGTVAAVVIALGLIVCRIFFPIDKNGVVYSFLGSNYSVRDCIGFSKNITIPSRINGKPVVDIRFMAFYGCDHLISISLPESIDRINVCAFENCDNLTSINIPDSVTEISGYTFSGCSNLTEITIPKSVKTIRTNAFANSGLKRVTMSKDTFVSNDAFDDDVRFYLTIPKSELKYKENNGSLTITCYTPGTSDTHGYWAVPDEIDGKPVVQIGAKAFYNCSSLTGITTPDSVTSIGDEAFWYCDSLTGITLPDSVTSIGNYAFCGCSSLTGITLPDSVTSIGNYAFCGCSILTSITIPDSVTSIGHSAFSSCSSLTGIIVDENNNNYASEDGVLFNKDKTVLIQCRGRKNGKICYSERCNKHRRWGFLRLRQPYRHHHPGQCNKHRRVCI